MTRRQWMVAACGLAIGMAGCARGPQQAIGNSTGSSGPQIVQVQRPNLEGVTVTASLDQGQVNGIVRWQGPAEAPGDAGSQLVTINGREQPAQPNPGLQINPENQGIADAVIWIAKAPAGATAAPPAACKLTQKNGDFRPRIQTVPLESSLQVTTADDQANFQATGAANFNQNSRRGDPLPTYSLAKPGLVTFRSQVHPWMAAYIWVFDHPYFTQTDADGRFRLPELAPGEYQLVMWHPAWRSNGQPVQKEATVKVGPNQGATVQFTLTGSDGR